MIKKDIRCSICVSLGRTKKTCPLNQDSENPSIIKHPLSYSKYPIVMS